MSEALRAMFGDEKRMLQEDVADNLRVSVYGKKTDAGDTALAVDDADDLRVSAYVTDTNPGDKPIKGDSDGWVYVRNDWVYSINLDGQANAGVVPRADKIYAYPWVVKQYLFNGLTWDRIRSTEEFTVFVEAPRTATAISVDYINHNRVGMFIFLNILATATGETLTMQVQAKTPTSSAYFVLYQHTVSSTGLFVYAIYPGVTNISGHLTGCQDSPLPRTFRFRCIPSGSGTWNYGLGACIV